MTAAPEHDAQRRFTGGQGILAGLIVTGQLALLFVFFPALFITVNGLLGPSFNGWAWTVPIGTEVSFVIMYLLEVLLVWLDEPRRWLTGVALVFFALSLALNVYAGRANAGDMIGHAALVIAFFLPLLAWKTAVRGFAKTPAQRDRESMMRDARTHARDILHAALGWRWRWRAPRLLVRQVRSGRLPADVRAAFDGGPAAVETAVERWITTALTLPERVVKQLAEARRTVAETPFSDAPGDDQVAVELPSSTVAGPRSDDAPGHRQATVETAVQRSPGGGRDRRRTLVPGSAAWHPRTMSDDALMPYVDDLYAGDAGISQTQIAARLRIGDKRVKRLIDIRRRTRLSVAL